MSQPPVPELGGHVICAHGCLLLLRLGSTDTTVSALPVAASPTKELN